MVIPFTSNINILFPPTEIVIQPDKNNALERPAALKITAIHPIHGICLLEKRGHLSKKDMSTVDKACTNFFGIGH
jgi:hypothetical protein